MTPLRIAQVATSDASIRLLLLDHIRALSARGHQVTAVCAPGRWIGELRGDGIVVETVAMNRELSPLADARALCALASMFRKKRFDVIHTHTPKAGLLGPLAARVAGVRAVLHTVHGLLFHDRMPAWAQGLGWLPEKFTATLAHRLLSQSQEDIAVAARRRLCAAEKITYIGNGVDPDRFSRDPGEGARLRSRLGFSADDFVVGSVGRLVAEKGFEELFTAAEQLRTAHSAIRFVVIGPEDAGQGDAIPAARLRWLAERGIIHFAGWQNDMRDWYSMMDLFVLPSRREGLPRACMEASCAGLPVIATDIRGCREVVRHQETGLLVPMRNAAALAAAIEQMMQHRSQARQLGENGREHIRENFSSAQVLARLCAFYEGLAEELAAAE